MDIYSRYIFRQSFFALTMILGSLTGIVWLATALRQFKVVTTQGQSLSIFATMTALSMPTLIAIVAPMALLIACLHTLNRLNNDSEIIVMSAAGATVWKIAKPLILLSLLVMLAVASISFYFQPQSLQALRGYIVKVRTDLISQVIQPGDFSSPETGLTFHIRERSRNGDLLGLLIHDERDKAQTISYLAERGIIQKVDETALLIMINGQIQRKTAREKAENDVKIQNVAFDRYVFDLSQFGDAKEVVLKPKERHIWQLLSPPPDDLYVRNKRLRGRLMSDFHERVSSLLYPIVFVMIVIAFLGMPRTTRQGRMKAIISVIVIAAIVRVLGLIFTNLSAKQSWAIAFMYLIPLITLGIAVVLAKRRMSSRKETQLGHGFATILRIVKQN